MRSKFDQLPSPPNLTIFKNSKKRSSPNFQTLDLTTQPSEQAIHVLQEPSKFPVFHLSNWAFTDDQDRVPWQKMQN